MLLDVFYALYLICIAFYLCWNNFETRCTAKNTIIPTINAITAQSILFLTFWSQASTWIQPKSGWTQQWSRILHGQHQHASWATFCWFRGMSCCKLKLVRVACLRCHGTKCPLLMVFLPSSSSTYFAISIIPTFMGLLWKSSKQFLEDKLKATGRQPQLFRQMQDNILFLDKWKMTLMFRQMEDDHTFLANGRQPQLFW